MFWHDVALQVRDWNQAGNKYLSRPCRQSCPRPVTSLMLGPGQAGQCITKHSVHGHIV